MLKNLLKEIDNSITDDELINICSNEILLERKPFNLKNFILKIKQLNYKALPHFAFAKAHISKITKAKFFKKNQYITKLIKVITQLELAEYLLNQGATIEEIKSQTNLNNELLASIIKKYYTKLPKDILRWRLLNYRIMRLAKQQEIIFKEVIIPLVSKQDGATALALLKSFEELIMAESQERAALEQKFDEE